MQSVVIEYANETDIGQLAAADLHIESKTLIKKIKDRQIIVIRQDRKLLGWLRYNYFWDTVPFMNLLYVQEAHRNTGCGSKLAAFWEAKMKDEGHTQVMTSTLSNEQAQHFYRKRGYVDCGALLLPGEPLEILFIKTL